MATDHRRRLESWVTSFISNDSQIVFQVKTSPVDRVASFIKFFYPQVGHSIVAPFRRRVYNGGVSYELVGIVHPQS